MQTISQGIKKGRLELSMSLLILALGMVHVNGICGSHTPGFCHVNFPPPNIDLSLTFHVSCRPFVSDNDQPESGRVFPQEFTGYRVPCQVSLKTEICSMIFSWGVKTLFFFFKKVFGSMTRG